MPHVEIRVFGLALAPVAFWQIGPGSDDLELRAMVPEWWFLMLGEGRG